MVLMATPKVSDSDLGSINVELEFARKLAANDKLQRDKAMRNLWRWLRSESEGGKKFSQKDLLLVWKGLHYCMWMCDKPKVQDELATNIVKLSECFTSQQSSTVNFFDAFFLTLAREYYRIDRFRIDKFLTLTRRMFHQCLRWLQTNNWKSKLVEDLFARLQLHVMSGDSLACPEGLQGFITEVFLQELTKVLAEDESSTNDLTPIFTVFLDVLNKSNTPFLRNIVTKNVFHDLRNHGEIRKRVDVAVLANYALERGKDAKCLVKNRRALYNIYNYFSSMKPLVETPDQVVDGVEPENLDESE